MAAYIFGTFLVIMLVLWFAFRNQILQMAWEKAVAKTEKKGFTLTCSHKGFSGVFTVGFDSLHLHKSGNTLLFSEKLSVSVDIRKTLWNGPTIAEVKVSNTRITAINDANGCNYCGLIEKSERSKKSKDPLVQRVFNLIKRGLAKVPGTIELQNVSAEYRDTSNVIGVDISKLRYDGDDISGAVGVLENGKK
ncbi:MAG: hypothetical protein ACKO6I_06760, partial [Sphingomonadales bacterium]